MNEEQRRYRQLTNLADAYARIADPDGNPSMTPTRDFELPAKYFDELEPLIRSAIRGTWGDVVHTAHEHVPHFPWHGVACLRGSDDE